MENLTVKIEQVVQTTKEVPQFFRTNSSAYYKICSSKSFQKVNFYYTPKEEMEHLEVYPAITVDSLDHLYIFIRNAEITPVSEEEFNAHFNTCIDFINSLKL